MVNRDFPADPPDAIDDHDDTVPGSADPPVAHGTPGPLDPLPGQQVDEALAQSWSGSAGAAMDDAPVLDIETSAIEAVPTLPAPETPPYEPVDLAPPVLDIEASAAEAVPTVPMPDDTPAPAPPTPGQEIGHRLAAELREMAVPEDRPAAVRDLVHEMIQAGAEGEITPDLVREELPPEPFTDADYAAYDALDDEGHAS